MHVYVHIFYLCLISEYNCMLKVAKNLYIFQNNINSIIIECYLTISPMRHYIL